MRVLAAADTLERHPRLTVTDRDAGTIHYNTEGDAVYLIVTAADYPQRLAFKCIAELRKRFKEAHGEAMHKSAEGGLSRASKQLLADVCDDFADAGRIDRATRLMREVTEVKGIVQDSLSGMLATRENLEVLEDKTEQLRTEAANFQRKATTLRKNMWWRNCKLTLLVVVVVVVALALILVPLVLNFA